MTEPTYPDTITALQLAVGEGNEAHIRQAVAACLSSLEVLAFPVIGGGAYLMAGHYFLRHKHYADARQLYQQSYARYGDAYAASVPEAGWLRIQALLCVAQTYYRAGRHPHALQVWQEAHRLAEPLPEPSPLSVELAVRLAEAYRRDGQRRRATIHYEEALTLAETLPAALCPVPLIRVVYESYLPLLDTTPLRRQLQNRINRLVPVG